MMLYSLALIMCLGQECRSMWFPPTTEANCNAMLSLVLQEARDEGFRATAVCAPVRQEDASYGP